MPEPRPLIFQLYTTYQRAARLVAHALEGTGIRPEDAPLYSVLEREGPLTPTGLARALGVGASTLSYRLKALESAGAVIRRPHPSDRRSALIELSHAGRDRWLETVPTFAESLRRAERRVARQQDDVAAALEALAQAVDDELASL